MPRKTRQRQAVLSVLQNTNSHPTADQIYDQVRKSMPKISKGTVYRNLGILQQMGLVSELNLNGITSIYEIKQKGHYHFRCEDCGRVMDIDEPIDTALDQKVSMKTGLKIRYHQLEFRGLCRDCQEANDKKGGK